MWYVIHPNEIVRFVVVYTPYCNVMIFYFVVADGL